MMQFFSGTPTLCQSCARCKIVVSGTGSRFFLCRLAQTDTRFPKYPPQPVVRCSGYSARLEGDHDTRQLRDLD